MRCLIALAAALGLALNGGCSSSPKAPPPPPVGPDLPIVTTKEPDLAPMSAKPEVASEKPVSTPGTPKGPVVPNGPGSSN